MSRFVRLASSLLLSSAFLFSSVSASPAGSTVAAQDPSFVYGGTQTGEGGFQWYCGISTEGNAPNTYTLSFRIIGDTTTSIVDYVDLHYYIDNQVDPKNARMSNSTLTEYDKSSIILYQNDQLKFSFTYQASATGTAFDTYSYSFKPADQAIAQTTQVVTPIPGALLTSSQYSVDGFNWKVGIQTYTNVPDQVTVEFIADQSQGINWASLHYIIGNTNSLQNYLMTQNSTQQPNSGVIYYQDVTNLPAGELLKFNFTFWNVQDQVAQDSIAFVYSSTSNAVSVITNIAQNVDSNTLPSNPNPNPTTSSGGSTSTSGTSSSGSTTSTSGTTSTPSNTIYVNHPKNGAAGMLKTGFGTIAAVATVVAAVMAML